MAKKTHWTDRTEPLAPKTPFALACGLDAWLGSAKTGGPRWFNASALVYLDLAKPNPDWYCAHCVKAARLALAAESAPKRTSRCSVPGCGSHAINPGHHGCTEGADLDLCDVCYWRKRAESAIWPKPRPISEAPKDGSMVLICLPNSKPQWTMGVFDRTHWVDLCLVDAIVEPTHFLPLPPEVM